MPTIDVAGQHAVLGISLKHHFLHTPLVDEVINVATAPCRRKGVVDVRHRKPLSLCLVRVNFEPELGGVIQAIGSYGHQALVLAEGGEQLVARLHQCLMPEVGAVLQHQVEAGRVAELCHCRRREGEHLRISDRVEESARFRGNSRHAQCFALALVPGLELDECKARVLPAAREAEARNREDSRNCILLVDEEVMLHLLDHFCRACVCRARRQLNQRKHRPLILVRQEADRQLHEAENHCR
ncbi:hypothetical protein D3C85_967230 [compost metagenome]